MAPAQQLLEMHHTSSIRFAETHTAAEQQPRLSGSRFHTNTRQRTSLQKKSQWLFIKAAEKMCKTTNKPGQTTELAQP